MEQMNWVEAARLSDCGVAFRREGTTLYFVHPERGVHLGLLEDGYFLQMRFRESLLKPDWAPLILTSEEGRKLFQAVIGGVHDLHEE